MMRRNVTNAVLVSIAWCLLATVVSAAPPQKITTIEGITEYQLDNGMQVLLFPDDSKPSVTVNLTIFVGSRHEGYGETGMAHLLEHMLFKGTPTHPNIPKVLQERGARFNGTTWLDRTNYYETLPASDDNLEFAIRLEADRMVNSNVKAEDLASEMTVVRNEFERGENSPISILMQRMTATAFEWHNYGKSTIGNRADIERVPIENLKEFYVRYYQPDNALLVVAGRFDQEKALELVQKYFGSIPRPERELRNTYTEEPAQDGERLVTLRRVGEVAVVGTIYHIPAGPHPEFAAVDVLSTILTAAPAGRLYKALVESKKAASVFGGSYALHDPGMLLLVADVVDGNDPQVVLGTMIDVTEGVDEDPVTQEEVDRAKQQLLKTFELEAAKSDRLAIQLSDWAAQGDWRLYFLYRDRVEQVEVEQVQQAADKYLRRSNRTAGMYLPEESQQRVTIPPTPELAEMIGDYKGREAVAMGEAFDVSPANIDARSSRFELPSGLKVTFLPKKTRGESVNLRLSLRYGNVDSLNGRVQAAEFLPALMRRGTEKYTRQELTDELDKFLATLRASGSPGEATFTLETKRPNLVPVLEILRQILREPSLPDEELGILKRAQISQLDQALADPGSLASTAVNRAINPYQQGDPRYIPTIEESIAAIKALTVDDIRSLYEEFLGGVHGELTIVGDFDPEEIQPVVEQMVGNWVPNESYERITKVGDMDLSASSRAILTPDKANAYYFSGTVFPMRDDHPDYPALLMGNYILGSGGLSSRLGDRLRQKDGLSYTVRSSVQASSLDERAIFYLYAICNPSNIEKAKKAIAEEVGRLIAEGVTEEELQAAKQGYLQSRQVSRTRDSSLAAILEGNRQAGRTMAFQADLEERIANVTKDEVFDAVRKYIDPNRIVIVTAGDFESPPATQAASGENQ